MQDKLKKDTETSMQKSIDSFIEDLKKIRTGRANVSMLDNIMVNYYGNPSPLNQVASVSTPDAKSFVIAPWESSILKETELTEERRKDLAKNVKKIAEDARVAIRMARKDANDVLKKAHKDKEISEDDQKKYSDDIQKVTDNFIKKVDEISAQKESDILKV
jgi:ribosome recycling factor